jgi:hypothetical protein
MRSPRRRWALGCLGGLAALVVAVVLAGVWLHRPLPEGEEGPAADALARSMREAVRIEDWERTGAVRWTFGGRHHLLWDRERDFVRVQWKDRVVLLRLADGDGQAFVDGQPVHDGERRALLDEAYALFINDAFWLNPMRTWFDDGVKRARVPLDNGGHGLLVTYTSGGVTPGDSYLWIAGPDGRPARWRMWVSIVPIGGVGTTWEGWTQLDTGAWIATRHAAGPITLELTDVRGARTLVEISPHADPFQKIAANGPARQ